MLTKKAIKAAEQENLKTIVLAGGVAANSYLRENITKLGEENKIEILFPPIELCGDNAAMIGSLAYFNLLSDEPAKLNMSAKPNIPLE